MDLAYRSGEVSVIQAHVVYEGDKFEYCFGLDPKLEHVPATGKRGKAIAVYAVFRTKDGGYGFDVMSMDDVMSHARKYSKAFNNGPWQTNPEEMAKKTVLKRVLKMAPMKSDFVRGMAQDGVVKSEISEDMYTVTGEYVEADFTVDAETGEVEADFTVDAETGEVEAERDTADEGLHTTGSESGWGSDEDLPFGKG